MQQKILVDRDVKRTESRDTASDKNMFDVLSDDVVFHIVRFLNVRDRLNLMMVCKRFNMIIDSSWSSLQFLEFRKVLHDPVLINGLQENLLEKCGSYVKSIDMSKTTVHDLVLVNKYCKNLKCIKLSSECSLETIKTWERELCSLLENNKKITCLIIALREVSEKCFLTVQKLESLKTLNLTILCDLSLETKTYLNFLRNLKNLENVEICATITNTEELVEEEDEYFQSEISRYMRIIETDDASDKKELDEKRKKVLSLLEYTNYELFISQCSTYFSRDNRLVWLVFERNKNREFQDLVLKHRFKQFDFDSYIPLHCNDDSPVDTIKIFQFSSFTDCGNILIFWVYLLLHFYLIYWFFKIISIKRINAFIQNL